MQDKLLLDRLVNFNLDNPKDAYALNGKMSELGAALGISQLGKIDNIIKQRIQNVEKIYDAILKHGQSKWLKILDKLLALETWNGCYFPISFETRQRTR